MRLRDRRWAGLTHIRARAKCFANFDSFRALKSFAIDSSSRFSIGIELALAGCRLTMFKPHQCAAQRGTHCSQEERTAILTAPVLPSFQTPWPSSGVMRGNALMVALISQRSVVQIHLLAGFLLIPVIPFSGETQTIAETIETVPEDSIRL